MVGHGEDQSSNFSYVCRIILLFNLFLTTVTLGLMWNYSMREVWKTLGTCIAGLVLSPWKYGGERAQWNVYISVHVAVTKKCSQSEPEFRLNFH